MVVLTSLKKTTRFIPIEKFHPFLEKQVNYRSDDKHENSQSINTFINSSLINDPASQVYMGTHTDEGGHSTAPPAVIHQQKSRLLPIIRNEWVTIAIMLAGVMFLWFVYTWNYAFFHTTVEVIVIAIAFAIFLLVWRSRNIIDNSYLVFLGVAFLFFAILNFFHALAAPGIGIFQNGGGALSSQFWIGMQFLLAVSLLAAPLVIGKVLRFDYLVLGFFAIDVAIVASILVFPVFPVTYLNSTGQTGFKIVIEYLISLIMAGAIFLLYRYRSKFDRTAVQCLGIAIVLAIASEISLAFMSQSTDFYSFLGHIFRLFSFVFFFVAIIVIGLGRPYDLLYRELKDHEEQLKMLYASMNEGLAIHEIVYQGSDPIDYIVTDINPAYEKITGIPRSSAVGRRSREIYGTGEPPYLDLFARLATGGKPEEFEMVHSPTGQYFAVSVFSHQPGKFATIFRDITENRRAEHALAESHTRLLEVIESIQDDFYVLDRDWRFVYASKQFTGRIGKKPEDFIGNRIWEMFPGHLGTTLEENFRATMEKREIRRFEIPGKYTDAWFSMTSFPSRDGITVLGTDITDRRQAASAMKESEFRLNLALEAGELGWHDYRPETGEITWDRICRAIWGVGPEDPVNINVFWQGIHPDSVAGTEKKLTASLDPEGNGRFDDEYLVRPLDGSPYRWVHATGRTIFEGTGVESHAIRVIGTVQDITTRKLAREALKESEARLNLAQSAAGAGTWDWDVKNNEIVWSQNLFDLFGLDSRTVPASFEAWNQVIHPDDRVEANARIWWALERHMDLDNEFRIFRQDGEVRWINARGQGVYNSAGLAVRMSGICIDITERKLAEEDLRIRNSQIQALFDYSGASMVLFDAKPPYTVLVHNKYYQSLWAEPFSSEGLVGKNIDEFVPMGEAQGVRDVFDEVARTGKPKNLIGFPYEGMDRGRTWWNWHLSPVMQGGKVVSLIHMAFDVTKENQTRIELEEALKEKEVLLSEIHHRVKNNLAAFISLLSLEGSYDVSPAGLAMKKDLQNRARSMALIHETLYRTHKFSGVEMDIYLSTLVGQVVSSYESAKSIKTVVEAQGITLDLARATPAGLIVNELVTNSLKYAFPASFDCERVRNEPCTIRVRMTREDGRYHLVVSDNGVGLPDGLNPENARTLGLKLVGFLAKYQMKATVEAHSSPGAEFRFTFRDNGNQSTS
jgi:PAS domain S-box-containing protein